jgi:hypothetical protein
VACGWIAIGAALPTAVWRAVVGLGPTLGTPAAWRDFQDIPGAGSAYVLGLSVVQLGAALLTLVLIRPNGDRVPRWSPVAAGRRLPVWLVAGGALLGATVLAAICVMSVLAWAAVDPFTGAPLDGWAVLCRACYLVAPLWPLFLIITTIGYVRHRRR